MMTKDKAKTFVAAQLAYQALQHQEAAVQIPALAQNTEDAIRHLYEAAVALGFGGKFVVSCHYLEVNLPQDILTPQIKAVN